MIDLIEKGVDLVQRNRFKRILPVFVVLFSVLIGVAPTNTSANTANDYNFKEITIVIMPEYNLHPNKDVNGPNLLIGFHGLIENKSTEPITEIEIPIPANENNFALTLAANPKGDVEETVEQVEYTINENKNSVTLQLDEPVQPAGSAKFMIEYFYTPIKVAEGKKTFDYSYTAIADADLMNVMLFEPLGSESFETTPVTENQARDTMGVKMHLFEYTDVKAGETKNYNFSYIKEDNATTVEQIEQYGFEHSDITEPIKDAETKELGNNQQSFNVEISAGIALIILILVVFVILFVKRNKTKNSKQVISENNKKNLRKLLAEGKITEKEYVDQLSKLK